MSKQHACFHINCKKIFVVIKAEIKTQELKTILQLVMDAFVYNNAHLTFGLKILEKTSFII